MRVCLVSQQYPPHTVGGISSQTHAKAHGLVRLGHDVHVIAHSADGTTYIYRDGDVHVLRVAGPDMRLPICTDAARWLAWSVEVAAAIARVHTETPLDVIDVPEWAGEGFVHLINRASWSSIPTVVHLHGPLLMLAHTIGWPEMDSELYRIGTVMESTSIRLADAVCSSGRRSRAWCARHYGLDENATPILHTGVDTAHFAPRARLKDTRPTIVFVGRIATSKGVEELVDAASRLEPRIPGLRLLLVGGGEPTFIDRLRARAGHLSDLMEFRGIVSHEELPCVLAQGDVFAAPSWSEGGPGFVYLEAMACGLPVVAWADSGADEAVIAGETGLLAPHGDLVALTEALHVLLTDSDLRSRMGARARAHVIETADRGLCLARLAAFYEQVVHQAAIGSGFVAD